MRLLETAWTVNELSDSKMYIIERPACARTDDFEYVTIDSKTLTLLWSAPGQELTRDSWNSKLIHFQEYGNPPKAGCDASKDEFCEDYTGTVRIYSRYNYVSKARLILLILNLLNN